MTQNGTLYCKTHGGYILECMGCKNDVYLDEIKRLQKEVDRLKQYDGDIFWSKWNRAQDKLDIAVQALNFYASISSYVYGGTSSTAVEDDDGDRAREALEKIKQRNSY